MGDKSTLAETPTMTANHLARAKRNLLQDFSLVLVQEELDKGTWNEVLPQTVSKALGVHERRAKQLLSEGAVTSRFKQTSSVRINAVGGTAPEISPELKQMILDMNEL